MTLKVSLKIVFPGFLFLFLFSCHGGKAQKANENRMVYISESSRPGKKYDIFLYDFDAKKSENLTARMDHLEIRSNSSPKINHNNNSIYFLSFHEKSLVELCLQTKKVTRITRINYEATDFIIAPDGRSILYTERIDSNLQLVKINLTDGRKQNLSDNPCNNADACYSADGEKIVYVCDSDGSRSIAIMNNDGGDQRLLTNRFGDDRYPAISPDNKKIVFSSSRGGLSDSDYDLYIVDATGRNLHLFYDSNSYDTSPEFSPNGTYVAFISNMRGRLFSDIYLKEVNSGNIVMATEDLKYFNQNFVFSRDARHIIFENMGPADSKILMYEIHKKEIKNIIDHKGRDMSPAL